MEIYHKELEAWVKANPSRRKFVNQNQFNAQVSDSDEEGEDEEKKNQKNEVPQAPGKGSQIRIGHLKPILPDQVKIYDQEVKRIQQQELKKLEEFQRYSRQCSLCNQYKNEKEFISLTPCEHKFCKECLFDALSDSIKNGDVDRDSLVCPDCQGYLHYVNITQILTNNIALIAKLKEQKHYNNYTHFDYCPQCESYIFWDSNHDEQRCTCHYEFCKHCLLGSHQDVTCQQKIEAHKVQIQNGNEQMKPNSKYGVCIKCFTFGRKQMDTQIAQCVHCNRYFCCQCHQEFTAKHQCGVMVSDQVLVALGIK